MKSSTSNLPEPPAATFAAGDRLQFVSDLHLRDGDALTGLLLRYLTDQARGARAVFLLGDIFDVWLGDDLASAHAGRVADALSALSSSGVAIFLMRGNRDFLLGAAFSARCGASLLPDPSVIQHGAQRILLTHGDRYCVDDAAYQRYRAVVDNRWVQAAWFRSPLWVRSAIARRIRTQSRDDTERKPARITDVSEPALLAAALEADAPTIVHGHTHRPAIHRTAHDGRTVVRRVLPDWRPGVSVQMLESDGSAWQHHPLGSSADAEVL